MTVADTPVCRCSHPRGMHEHLRVGSDCGVCGRQLCPAYRRPPTGWADAAAYRLNRLLALIRRRR